MPCHKLVLTLQARWLWSPERAAESDLPLRNAWDKQARASAVCAIRPGWSVRPPVCATSELKRWPFLRSVSRADHISALAEKTQKEFGPVDILVNNAGIGVFGPFHQFGEDDWNSVLDTNLKAVFLLSSAVAPEMIRRQTGYIINISSLADKNSFANGAIYCASKWGLMGLTACMAERPA